MKRNNLNFVQILFIFTVILPAQIIASIQYVSPRPGSVMVSHKTNIILRSTIDIDESTGLARNIVRIQRDLKEE